MIFPDIQRFPIRAPRALPLLLTLCTLAACATRPPSDFHGSWTPVNRYSETPQAIPLQSAYQFYATPLDRTLKGMLERWARDSRLTLDYGHESDFTLFRQVADVRTGDLPTAIRELNILYAAQRVHIRIDGDRLLVRRIDATDPSQSPAH